MADTAIFSITKGVPVTLQAAGSSAVGNGTRFAVSPALKNHKISIKTSAGVATGEIQPESAPTQDYTGVWSPIGGGPITVPAASSVFEYAFSGSYQALGARISTIIGGGTVEVTLVSW